MRQGVCAKPKACVPRLGRARAIGNGRQTPSFVARFFSRRVWPWLLLRCACYAAQSGVFGKSEDDIRALDSLASGSFSEVVDGGHGNDHALILVQRRIDVRTGRTRYGAGFGPYVLG